MQQRRYRPGDVLDDYCPRERRITDHAIVAMIDDHIKQTRCVVCDAEHEYKDGKVPPQRRKKPQAALFSQVLDGLTGPTPPRATAQTSGDGSALDPLEEEEAEVPAALPAPAAMAAVAVEESAPLPMEARAELTARPDTPDEPTPVGEGQRREEGPWRRQLIRAALPRPEGQPPPQTRPAPDFTIRQPNNARGHRHGRRRGGGGFAGASGNGDHGQGQGRFGRGGQPHGQGGGRRRRGRGGKKNN